MQIRDNDEKLFHALRVMLLQKRIDGMRFAELDALYRERHYNAFYDALLHEMQKPYQLSLSL